MALNNLAGTMIGSFANPASSFGRPQAAPLRANSQAFNFMSPTGVGAGMHFSQGGAIPDTRDTSGDNDQVNNTLPAGSSEKDDHGNDKPYRFVPHSNQNDTGDSAIPNSPRQGTDINEAMATVDHVLQFGRSQSGLGAPPSAIPNSGPDQTGYARGGTIHGRGPGRKGNKFKGSEDGSAGEGGPDLNSDFHFGEQGADAEDVPQPGAAPGSPQTSPQYSPMGLQTQPSYADGGDVEDPADSSLVPEQQAIPTDAPDSYDPHGMPQQGQQQAPGGAMQSAQGDTGAGMAPQKIVGYLQGAGAASAKAVKAAEDATGEEQPAMRALAVINDAYKHGGPEAAWPIMQSYRQQHELQTTLAKVKLQQGNVGAAAQAATEADANVLDGTQTHFSPTVGGKGVTATTTKLGNDQPFQHVKMGLQQFGNFLKTIYDQKMDESTAVTLQKIAKSPAGAGGLPGIGDGQLPAGQPAQGGRDQTPVPDMSGFDPTAAGGPGAVRTGNEGPTPPLRVPGGFGAAGAAINKSLGGDQPAAGGEPGPNAGTETSTPDATDGQVMMPPRGTSPVAAPQPGQGRPGQTQAKFPGSVEGSQLEGFNPRNAAADRRYSEMEKLYGPENVAMAYEQFPAGANADVRGRAAFLNAQKAVSTEQESKENQAASVQKGKLEVADRHYGVGGYGDRHDAAVGTNTQLRVAGRIQEAGIRAAQAGTDTQLAGQYKQFNAFVNADPSIARDDVKSAALAKRLGLPVPGAQQPVNTGQVNRGVAAPGPQVAAPQQNRTVIINNKPFLVGPDNKVVGPAQ